MPDKNGVSARETLEGLLARRLSDKARAEVEADLQGPPLPAAGAYLWDWFLELHDARPAGGMGGPASLTYADIQAWCGLRGVRLAPWETAALTALDRAFRRAMAKG
ncbi:phage tail assembly chaperone [Falsiroseomonas selenitidurans]|uniref:Uncharacterized protein n=1 Tax=Falsiroseomonas selenitidurans TaxID=2716335 RepID=A0ABX1E312_9PROT|nr:hypothetical protein [Falsiroseomonas selenitidurans]NKC30203.1 hypothetical protein [Falsiroseomonas selenitidurans]